MYQTAEHFEKGRPKLHLKIEALCWRLYALTEKETKKTFALPAKSVFYETPLK